MAGGCLLVVGAGAHARAVADLARACGWTVGGFVGASGAPARAEVVGVDDDLPQLLASGRFDGVIVGIGNTALARRAPLFGQLRDLGVTTPALVHPSAVVSPSAHVGAGSVVFPQVSLGADVVVGEDGVLYSGVVVEHDCRIGDHAYLAPGVVLCGAVRVESGAFVGAGAVVVPGVVIGKDAIVTAGARILTDVAAGVKTSGHAIGGGAPSR